jgi:hypothetical protein
MSLLSINLEGEGNVIPLAVVRDLVKKHIQNGKGTDAGCGKLNVLEMKTPSVQKAGY